MKRILLALLLMCILTTALPAAAEEEFLLEEELLLEEEPHYPTQIVLAPVKFIIECADDLPAVEIELELPVAAITWGFFIQRVPDGAYCGGYLDEKYPQIKAIEMREVEVSQVSVGWPEMVRFSWSGNTWQVDLLGSCSVTYGAVLHFSADGRITMVEERTEELAVELSVFGP